MRACSAFAVVAPPQRMVVDREAFQVQTARKIREAAEERSLREVDAAIARLKRDSEAFFAAERAHLTNVVR